MLDRFRFRVWNKKEKYMIYNAEAAYDGNNYAIPKHQIEPKANNDLHIHCFSEYIYNPEEYETEQCTGLKDKNGKLIYEGDILYKKGTKNHKGEKMYSEVIWDQMYAEFNISDDNGMHRMPSNSNNIEIIGNIYENPELLQGDYNV